jgi:hypothetical protein
MSRLLASINRLGSLEQGIEGTIDDSSVYQNDT